MGFPYKWRVKRVQAEQAFCESNRPHCPMEWWQSTFPQISSWLQNVLYQLGLGLGGGEGSRVGGVKAAKPLTWVQGSVSWIGGRMREGDYWQQRAAGLTWTLGSWGKNTAAVHMAWELLGRPIHCGILVPRNYSLSTIVRQDTTGCFLTRPQDSFQKCLCFCVIFFIL